MTWQTRANDWLRRATGYQLEKPKRQAPRARGRARQDRFALRKDFDKEAGLIIHAVRERTMTSSEKLFGLISAVRYVVQHDIPGAIVECGVWRGGSMQAAALALLGEGVTERDLYLFDTFEGMPPPTPEDRRPDGRSAAALLAASDKSAWIWAIASLEDVQHGMAEVGYPTKRIHYVKGPVEETVPDTAPDQIALLRLDTDWYESTKHELDHLYPRVSSGGVLIIDDYGSWEGSRKAVDEFLEKSRERVLLVRLNDGRIAVKP